jgi:hypothetical protein
MPQAEPAICLLQSFHSSDDCQGTTSVNFVTKLVLLMSKRNLAVAPLSHWLFCCFVFGPSFGCPLSCHRAKIRNISALFVIARYVVIVLSLSPPEHNMTKIPRVFNRNRSAKTKQTAIPAVKLKTSRLNQEITSCIPMVFIVKHQVLGGRRKTTEHPSCFLHRLPSFKWLGGWTRWPPCRCLSEE